MSVTTKPIADQLREAITASGLSLRELATRADSNAMSLSKFMRGGSIRIETAEAIAQALGMKSLKIPSKHL
jgi:transcriptional regulator with XRE-family HTH domain